MAQRHLRESGVTGAQETAHQRLVVLHAWGK
jgi:hypothetical protein